MTGSEVLIGAAISGVAVPVFQSLWQGGGRAIRFLGKTLDDKTREVIFQASRQYGNNYFERHGILKVLGMREAVPLESVYTTVQFLGDQELQGLESVDALETAYRASKRRGFSSEKRQKQPGLKVVNEKQFLMVLGGPGAGKSTFLRRMGLEALKGTKGKYQHHCIPVLIELKEFRTSEINIEQKIAEEFQVCGFPDYQRFTTKALEQGKLLILLDGLDEVPTKQMNEVIRQIQDFVDLYDKNRFVTSCRVAAYRHNFRRFTDVAMAEFDDEQIQTFINNWFRNDPVVGQDCWQKLNSPDHSAAKELTHTPLLLTLVCLLYQRARQFPTKRATLYEKALRILLEEWAGEKGLPQEQLYKGLDTRLKETMLSEIAYQTFAVNRLFFPRREVAEQIKQFLEEVLSEEKFVDGEAVLRAIEVQHGVLVQRAEGIYSFSHLTLQEYLTAQYIDDHRQIESLVTQHLTDNRWREVFLLVAGLMRGGVGELLLQIEQQAQTYICSPKLKLLLRWADQITASSTGNYKPAAKRAVALALTRALARAPARGRALTLDLERTLALALDRDLALALTRDRDLTRDLTLTLTLARDLTRDRDLTLTLARDCNLARDLEPLKIFADVNFTVLFARLEVLKTEIPDANQPLEVRQKLAQSIQQTWCKALQLSPGLVNLTQDDFNLLSQYLNANLLMVQCNKEAVRTSRQTWSEIEERMLKVQD